jgi:hypothetical protein
VAHYALLDENNIVTQVITGLDETELIEGLDPETWYGNFHNQTCKRTSYNTFAGEHRLGGVPFRKNYAGIGFTYDPELDAFIAPKRYESWILNEETCLWEAPIPKPDDALIYAWDEETLSWVEMPNEEEPDAVV